MHVLTFTLCVLVIRFYSLKLFNLYIGQVTFQFKFQKQSKSYIYEAGLLFFSVPCMCGLCSKNDESASI